MPMMHTGDDAGDDGNKMIKMVTMTMLIIPVLNLENRCHSIFNLLVEPTNIHSKSKKVCGVCFSVTKNL